MTTSLGDGVRLIGRYALHGELASGGMAAVHLGRLLGPVGFARTVAIKRLHSHHARDPEFVRMFLDEARIVARIKHPNVVPTLDVVALEGELFLVMEYVHGAPVSKVMMALGRLKERMPVNIAVGICLGVLEGLHAAHEAKSEDGTPLDIVHRDVSPQNVVVGADGIARVLDFGIAKASERLQTTEDGSYKGKLGYMPPDVLCGRAVDRRADLWGTAVVLWEMLVGKRLFSGGDSPHALVRAIVEAEVELPSRRGVALPSALEHVLARGLMKDPDARFATARDMASALEGAAPVASSRVIGEWLARVVGDQLDERAARVEEMERLSRVSPPSDGTVRSFTESGATGTVTSSRSGANAVVAAISSKNVLPVAPDASVDGVSPSAVSVLPAPSPAPPAAATSRATLLALVIALAALLVVGSVGVGVIALRRPAPPPPASNAAVSAPPNVAASAPPLRPESSAEPLASVALEPPPRSSAPVAVSAAKPPSTGKASPPRSGSTPPKSCNPPYTIGPPPDYIRKPKLECLQQ